MILFFKHLHQKMIGRVFLKVLMKYEVSPMQLELWMGNTKLSGTLYHNYKGVYSMVLLAVCDVDYCFTMYDFGNYGSNNDSGVLANSTFRTRLKSN